MKIKIQVLIFSKYSSLKQHCSPHLLREIIQLFKTSSIVPQLKANLKKRSLACYFFQVKFLLQVMFGNVLFRLFLCFFFQYKESNAWNSTAGQFLNLMCVYVICNFLLINWNSEYLTKNHWRKCIIQPLWRFLKSNTVLCIVISNTIQ